MKDLIEWVSRHPQIAIFLGAAVIFWLKERFQKKRLEEVVEEEKWPGDDGEVVDWGEPTKPLTRSFEIPVPLASAPPPLPVDRTAEELQRQADLQERLRQARAMREAKTPKVPEIKIAPSVTSLGLRARLRDRKEVRRAIVMKEILGPPVGLR